MGREEVGWEGGKEREGGRGREGERDGWMEGASAEGLPASVGSDTGTDCPYLSSRPLGHPYYGASAVGNDFSASDMLHACACCTDPCHSTIL